MSMTKREWAELRRRRTQQNDEQKQAREAAQHVAAAREAAFRAQSEAFTQTIRNAYEQIIRSR